MVHIKTVKLKFKKKKKKVLIPSRGSWKGLELVDMSKPLSGYGNFNSSPQLVANQRLELAISSRGYMYQMSEFLILKSWLQAKGQLVASQRLELAISSRGYMYQMSEFLILRSWSQVKGFRFKYIVFFFFCYSQKKERKIYGQGGGVQEGFTLNQKLVEEACCRVMLISLTQNGLVFSF